jgi:FkbM family methyltransferase
MIRYVNFLAKIEFKPKVIYDIGAYRGNWMSVAQEAFPNARVIGFETSTDLKDYHSMKEMYYAAFTDQDAKELKMYQLPNLKRVNSYYLPHLHDGTHYVEKLGTTLKTYVETLKLPEPDMIKIDTCGSEMDIIKGSEELIKKAKYLIVNLQNNETYKGAPQADVVGPYIQSLGFEVKDVLDCNGTPMIDYVFENKNI